MAYKKTKRLTVDTVAQYIAAGSVDTGYYLLESEVAETEKAVAFKAVGSTAYGNPCWRKAWFPKSKVRKLINDYYTNEAPDHMWAVPSWLITQRQAEGLDVFDTF